MRDQLVDYIKGLREAGKQWDQILFGCIMRFHPNRAEYADARFGNYKLHKNRKQGNEDIRKFNNENKYNQQITAVKAKYIDVYGRTRYTNVLTIIDNENADYALDIHKRHRHGYDKKIKRISHLKSDTTVKTRARKLLLSIEK